MQGSVKIDAQIAVGCKMYIHARLQECNRIHASKTHHTVMYSVFEAEGARYDACGGVSQF